MLLCDMGSLSERSLIILFRVFVSFCRCVHYHQVQLLMQYREERDVLCADALAALLAAHPRRVSMAVALSRPPAGWARAGAPSNPRASFARVEGYLRPAVFETALAAPGPGTLVCLCGSGGFCTRMKASLEGMGYATFVF